MVDVAGNEQTDLHGRRLLMIQHSCGGPVGRVVVVVVPRVRDHQTQLLHAGDGDVDVRGVPQTAQDSAVSQQGSIAVDLENDGSPSFRRAHGGGEPGIAALQIVDDLGRCVGADAFRVPFASQTQRGVGDIPVAARQAIVVGRPAGARRLPVQIAERDPRRARWSRFPTAARRRQRAADRRRMLGRRALNGQQVGSRTRRQLLGQFG
jgi:hypothetical protein